MTELIKVSNEGAVSARDLHQFFDSQERFSKWWDRMRQYGFEENVDYVGCTFWYTRANQELQDYALTLSAAKEIAMLQRNDKGKIARQYFIECEKRLKEQPKLMSTEEMIIAQAQSVIEVKNKVALLEEQVKELNVRTATRPDFFTVVGYATLHNAPEFSLKVAQNIGKKAARLAKESGIELDSCPDPRFGRVRMYPSTILKQAFASVMAEA